MRLLAAEDLRRLLPMREAIAAVEAGFRERAVVPERLSIEVGDAGHTLFMPGFLPGARALGMKVVSLFPGNASLGLPSAMGAVLMLDAATGAPDALLDGTFLTALRTGAASGVATRLLAREDAAVAAVLGAGGLAWHQVEAVCAVRPVREVRVWNRTAERARALAGRIAASLGVAARACGSGREAVEGADVVCCCTASPEPVLRSAWLAPGAHVNAVGSFRPGMAEIEPAVARLADRCAVDASGALGTGDMTEAGAAPFLSAMLRGEAPVRRGAGELTLFKSVGFAALDLAVAARALELAREAGAGCEIEL